MPDIGRQHVTITRNAIRSTGGGSKHVFLLASDEHGEAVPIKIWLTPKAMGMAQQQLAALGFNFEKQHLALLRDDPTLLEGKRVLVDVEENEYNGQTYMEGRIVLDDVSDEDLENLTQMLRKPPKSKAGAKPRKAAAAKAEADAPPEDEDDVPF